jgi:hypothetical protein
MHLYSENGRHIGWFDKNSVIQATKGLPNVIYGLACSKEKPDNSVLPCFYEDTFYIGMSGGMHYDKKNRKYPGSIQMNSTKRMFQHNKHLYNPRTKDKKYRLFHEKYALFHNDDPDLMNSELRVWYSLSIPNKDMNEILTKAFMHMVEDEYIYFYIKTFGNVPVMNLDHKSSSEKIQNKSNRVDRRVPNTLSHDVMKGNTLSEFLVA